MVPLSEAPSAEASDEAVLLLPQAESERASAPASTPLSTREKIRFFFMDIVPFTGGSVGCFCIPLDVVVRLLDLAAVVQAAQDLAAVLEKVL